MRHSFSGILSILLIMSSCSGSLADKKTLDSKSDVARQMSVLPYSVVILQGPKDFYIDSAVDDVISYSRLGTIFSNRKASEFKLSSDRDNQIYYQIAGSYGQPFRNQTSESFYTQIAENLTLLVMRSFQWGNDVALGERSPSIVHESFQNGDWHRNEVIDHDYFRILGSNSDKIKASMTNVGPPEQPFDIVLGDNEITFDGQKMIRTSSPSGYSPYFLELVSTRLDILKQHNELLTSSQAAMSVSKERLANDFKTINTGDKKKLLVVASRTYGLRISSAPLEPLAETLSSVAAKFDGSVSPVFEKNFARLQKSLADVGFTTTGNTKLFFNQFEYIEPSKILKEYPDSITVELLRGHHALVVIVYENDNDEWRIACILNKSYVDSE